MKKRWKWKLIAFFAVISSLLLLGGCKFQYTLDEKREQTGMNVCVTYYANGSGAYFGTKDTVKKLYFSDGSIAINIGVDRVTNGSVPTPTRTNYTLLGWYEAQLDDDGNVLKDSNGDVVLKDEAFDFKTKLNKGDNVTLYAKWKMDEAVHVYLVCDEITTDAPFTLSDGTVVENKALIRSYDYASNGKRSKPTPQTATGYTAFEYYMDEACTQVAQWPIDSATAGDCNIYLKYIKGTWSLLKTADNVKGMFSSTATRNYYLVNDIDCTGITVDDLATFTSNLQGNGFTISNLTVNGGTLRQSGAVVSTFGKLRGEAKIENVAFEHLTFKCTLADNVKANAFIFCSEKEDTALINNVTLKGAIKMMVERETSAILTNMERNGAWHTDNVLFGIAETDQEALNNGLSVSISEANVSVERNTDEIVAKS